MIRSGELRIHYTTIPQRIETYFGDRIKDQHELDTWDFDLRNQTLLHRDAAGYYEFAHKSLAEYFVAFKFAAELGILAPVFIETYCEANGQPCNLPIQKKHFVELAETFGATALANQQMQAVRDFLLGMMLTRDCSQLWKLVSRTRGTTPEQIKYAGGNAVTLLRMNGKTFKNKKLEETVLIGADLSNTDLSGADLRGACLSRVVQFSARVSC